MRKYEFHPIVKEIADAICGRFIFADLLGVARVYLDYDDGELDRKYLPFEVDDSYDDYLKYCFIREGKLPSYLKKLSLNSIDIKVAEEIYASCDFTECQPINGCFKL